METRCAICGRSVALHDSYILRMELLADPGTPNIDTESDEDSYATVQELLEQIKQMSADELQDQVYRKLEFRLCGRCHAHFLANPLGLPRHRKTPRN